MNIRTTPCPEPPMRVQRLVSSLLSLAIGLTLHAQAEPNLMTTTDLSDVYQSRSASTSLVLILDSTVATRGVFESIDYLTDKSRRAFLGPGNGMGSSVHPGSGQGEVGSNTVFSEPGKSGNNGIALNRTNPVLGYVFGMSRQGTSAQVKMYTWPSGSPVTVRTAIGGNTEVVGQPVAYSGTGTGMSVVSWQTDVLTTLKNGGNPVTHIRFTVNGRTIDLPCPWKIFDSPSFVAQPTTPSTAVPFPPVAVYQRNFQRNQTFQTGHTGIPYDTYSDNTANATRTIANYPDTILGQFYYSPDYLSWIFYGQSIRGSYPLVKVGGTKAGTVDWATNSYGYLGGYAVPTTTDTVTISGGTGKGEGFANHLPCLTRLQAQKVAVINAFVDKWNQGNWYYRFMAPAYGDNQNDEEVLTGSPSNAYATPSVYRADRDGAETNEAYLSDLRTLNGTYLTAQTSALQKIGSHDLVGTQTTPVSDFGTSNPSTNATFDAFTPMPMAVALANTYRKIIRDGTKFSTGACSGGVVVVPLASTGMNDSLTTEGDQLSAYNGNSGGYYFYTHGNTNLSKGGSNYPDTDVTNAMAGSTFLPGSTLFHPAVMSAYAAFGLDGVTNNASDYNAPWNDPSTHKTRGIQTMSISLSVPGTYVLASDNDGRNPHEEFFDLAQWGNPSNKAWAASNPAPSDDLIYYYQPSNSNNVRYFPSADPASLEQAIRSISSYVIYGKAALSAPATPATGVQNANQAYFGTFQTTATTAASDRVPLWTGNLYAIGLQRTTVPGTVLGTVQNVFQFYGGDATNGFQTIVNTGTATADFDVINLWSAFNIFGNYQNAPAANLHKILGGATLSWRNRIAYILSATNDLETYLHSADDGTSSTQLTRIIGWVTAKDPTGQYYLSSTVKAAGGTSPTNDQARNLMRFLLGAYDPTNDTILFNRDKSDADPTTHALLGHLNIMGDIVNSAPQAVELSKDIADTLPNVVTGDSFYTSAYSSSYTDPHTRLIIVGTNTGHLHCFVEVAAKNASGYYEAKATELWTFLPPNLFPMLWDLYNQRTQTDPQVFKHHYGIDGDPMLHHIDVAPSGSVIGDTRVSLNEDAAIIFSFRKGARDVFSLKISDSNSTTPTPAYPRLAWWIKPITGDIVKPSATDSSQAGLIRTMGMSTCVPSFGLVEDSTKALRHVVFISGGYANDEINARYLNDDAIASTTYFQKGLGRLILALDPMTGALVRTTPWDFRSTSIGAIAGGVVPAEVINQGTGLTQRIYFGDYNGGVWAINADSTNTNGFRNDSAAIDSWYANDKVRAIYKDANVRFTTAPDAFRLPGDFPVPVTVTAAGIDSLVRPLTAMVTLGSGDRNNPIDAPEDYSYVDKNGVTHSVSKAPPTYNRFYVFADLQNASGAIADTSLQLIDSSWATTYADLKVTAGSTSYLWAAYDSTGKTYSKYRYGYYFDLPHTYDDGAPSYLAPAGNSPNSTRDKVMVSPLIKQSALFYSFYNIYGSSGFACSPFSTTRTFRQCDIVRPLWFDPELDVSSTRVGDITTGTGAKSGEGCSGLAFSFNSLSSQLVDAGDYVMQGGAKASTATGVAGSNTPDIQSVKDTANTRGFRIRNWRIVR